MKRRFFFGLLLVSVVLIVVGCAPAAAPLKRDEGASSKPPAAAQDSGAAVGRPAQAPAGQPAAPAPAPSAAPGTAPGGEKLFTDRMIINNAQLSMEVKDSTDSLGAIGEIAQRQGGFIVSSNFHNEGDRKVATVALRVPSIAYQATLTELRRLAVKVEAEDSKAQDVTEEYTDLQAQLRNLEATEAQYQELLKRAQSIDEILKVQGRLTETRRDIERIKGRVVYLERTTEMSSITVTLFSRDGAIGPKEPEVWWRTPAEAFNQSLVFLSKVASALAIGVAFFWWLILLVAGGYFAVRIAGSRRTA